MTLRHLRIFVAVCESKSVTAAAEKLYLAQPSVSLAIRELEDYYGVKLFDRISRKLFITEIGNQFLNYATHIVCLFGEMEQGIKNWDRMGTLRVGSSITIGNYLLPNYVRIFQEQHPLIKVKVVIDNSVNIEERVIANDIDFALIEGVIHNPQIKYIKFMEDKLVLICGNNHPISNVNQVKIEDLKEYDFILRERGSGGRELFDSTMLIHNIEIKPTWESVSTRAIVSAVSAGLGLSLLPYFLVKQDIEAGIIRQVRIKDISFDRKYYIIYHKNKFITNSAKDFMNLCKTRVFY